MRSRLVRALRQPGFALRRLTAGARALPDFLIIGAQKSGTTSLYAYLTEHPDVLGALRKEVHFFDLNWRRGVEWYRAHFPIRAYKKLARARASRVVTGEGTPYYLYHRLVPDRVADVTPAARFIVLLRDPIQRAYASYHLSLRNGREDLEFKEALGAEAARLDFERERWGLEAFDRGDHHINHSYLARGRYHEQLVGWFDRFPREHFLIMASDSLFTEPYKAYGEVVEFLGLRPWDLPRYRNYNPASYPDLDSGVQDWLREYFAPHNQRLYELLDTDLGWG